MLCSSMFPLPAAPQPKFTTRDTMPKLTFSRGNSEENILSSPRGDAVTRSKSQDLRKTLLTAAISSSCPDLLEDGPVVGATLKKQSRIESCDLLTSRLGGATQRSRALGIGLQRKSSAEGSSRAQSPSLSKICQESSGNSTPVSSRRAGANSSSKDSPLLEEKYFTPNSTAKLVSKIHNSINNAGNKTESHRQNCTVNGHVKLHRTSVPNVAIVASNSDDNSRESSAVARSEQSDVTNVSVLKLTKENLTENIKQASEKRRRDKAQLKPDAVKKENKSFLKNLFGFRKKPFRYGKECNNTPDVTLATIPDTMTRAQYERCCKWLEGVERPKNNRCLEVTAAPPPIWSE